MHILIFSALAHRVRERCRIFAEPRFVARGNTTAIPRLLPTVWRVLRNHWRVFRKAAVAKKQK